MKRQTKQRYLGRFELPYEYGGRVNINELIKFLLEEQKLGAKEVEFGFEIYHEEELDEVCFHGFVETLETDEEYNKRIESETTFLKEKEAREFGQYLKLKEKFKDKKS